MLSYLKTSIKIFKYIITWGTFKFSGGALLVLEKTLHDDKGGPLPALLEDVGMATLSIGHERSGKEYRNLLAKHGFDQIEIKEIQGSNHFDAIYAIKTEQ